MVPDKAQILQSSTIRWQFVCDEGIWDKALLFQQFAYHLERCLLVFCVTEPGYPALRLHYRQRAIDTSACWRWTRTPHQGATGHLVEGALSSVSGHRLARTSVPSAGPFRKKHQYHVQRADPDIPVAEGKPEIQPDSVLNDHRWKSVSGIGDFLHPATLRRHQRQVTLLV